MPAWDMILIRLDQGHGIARSRLESFGETGSQTNLRATLSASLNGPAIYYLGIRRSSFRVDGYDHKTTCEPFLWDLTFVPALSSNLMVFQVEPSNLVSFHPDRDLRLSLEFTEEIFSHSNVSATSKEIVSAFSLVATEEKLKVAPFSAEGGGRFWILTFEGPFLPQHNYELRLNEGFIFGSDGSEASILSKHRYSTMDVMCRSKGTALEEGYCLCEKGYAGRECEVCEIGYDRQNSGGSEGLVCVLRESELSFGYYFGLFLAITFLIVNGGYFIYLKLSKQENLFQRLDMEKDSNSLFDDDDEEDQLGETELVNLEIVDDNSSQDENEQQGENEHHQNEEEQQDEEGLSDEEDFFDE
mmetsp:Transcript_36655/g.50428  ORF Transcript_36655/g.50428 Transcript_36655/m.50428 type:complete len:357 (+) Transcript_36655:275-1345(+)